MKHLLKLMDLSEKEIIEILNLADQLKYEKKNGIEHHILKGHPWCSLCQDFLPSKSHPTHGPDFVDASFADGR